MSVKKIIFLLGCAFLLFVFVHALTARAASLLPGMQAVTLLISPQYPTPGSRFTAEVHSLSFDLTRSQIRWYFNNSLATSGVGLRQQNFAAGQAGTSARIRAVVTNPDGSSYEVTTSILVGDIDLIVAPETYTPAFYRGAALPTPGSIIGIYAVPHLFSNGKRLDPQTLIYEWYVDDKFIKEQSGGGQNRLSIRLADIRGIDYLIEVTVSTQGGGIVSKKATRLFSKNPEIVFYQNNPLTGKFARAANSFAKSAGSQFSVLAEPFYFDLGALKRIEYLWSANGKVIDQHAKNPRLLEITTPPSADSHGTFSLKLQDKKSIFQQAEAAFSVSALR